MSQPKHLNIRVHGRVQGVFFRAHAAEMADELGLAGFVRNEPDGTVYAEVEGETASVEQFLAWCRQGSPDATVEQVQAAESAARHYHGFETR